MSEHLNSQREAIAAYKANLPPVLNQGELPLKFDDHEARLMAALADMAGWYK